MWLYGRKLKVNQVYWAPEDMKEEGKRKREEDALLGGGEKPTATWFPEPIGVLKAEVPGGQEPRQAPARQAPAGRPPACTTNTSVST